MAAIPTEKLKLISWRNIEVRNELFLIKFLRSKDSYELLLMDRKEGGIWYEQVDQENLLNRNKVINPAIEMPLDKLLQQIAELTDGSSAVSGRCHHDTPAVDRLTLSASRLFAGLKFVWEFILHPVNNKVLAEHFTEPVMLMLSETLRRQRALCVLLKNKDREIDDMKAQAVQLTRKKLETKRFDEDSFHKERDSSPGRQELLTFDSGSIFDSRGQNLYTNISEFLVRERDVDNKQIVHSDLNTRMTSNNQSASSAIDKSTNQSPAKRPGPSADSMEVELQRRQELEQRLAEKDEKEAKKKKKKLNL